MTQETPGSGATGGAESAEVTTGLKSETTQQSWDELASQLVDRPRRRSVSLHVAKQVPKATSTS